MQDFGRFCWLLGGVALGVAGMWLYFQGSKPVLASGDRYEDYILCTGPASLNPKGGATDGVWLLDYRSGKLLGTIIDKNGKIGGWQEVDLVTEFGVQPKQAVHFLMTTGSIAPGQAALYVAETATGKFGVYSLGPRQDGKSGVVIRRHDLVMFRPGGG